MNLVMKEAIFVSVMNVRELFREYLKEAYNNDINKL